MAILALALYGSRARGDNSEQSDVDLFAITDDDKYRMMVNGKTNVACYPLPLALERAAEGDLFILHICSESKELYESLGELNELKSTFRYKENYFLEVSQASDLAWFLVDSGPDFRNFTLLNKRIAWCVRTILIAKSAQMRIPFFAASKLVEFSGMPDTAILIDGKNSNSFRPELIEKLIIFLNAIGAPRPNANKDKALTDYFNLFKVTSNSMGLKTLRAIQGDTSAENYT